MRGPDETIITPVRGAGEPEIPAVGIFCLNPGDAEYLGKKARESGGRRQFLFNSSLYCLPEGDGKSACFVAGPAVGAPMAVMTLEKLIALGCRKLVTWGWCGALLPGLRVGDLTLPSGGLSEEGTSRHYPVAGGYDGSETWRRELGRYLTGEGWQYREGAVWSTDAPYRETRTKVDEYAARGVLAVEMEYTALATVAAFRQIELATLLIVSDELWGESWRPGFRSREFKCRNRALLDGLLAWVKQLNG